MKSLFGGMSRRKQRVKHAHLLYGMVVANARDPDLFKRFEMPDTFDGRFEMLVTHLYVLNKRLQLEGDEGRALSQDVFDLFIEDMDSTLRELAVGDQVVPKRLAKMTRVIHGRASAYDRALENAEDPKKGFADVVSRNVFEGRDPQDAEFAMAGWMLDCLESMKARALEELMTQQNVFSQADT